jgi:hypothetical protein
MPLSRAAALFALALAAGCARPATVAVHAVLCNLLTNDTDRAGDDYSDLTCAAQARIRVFRDGDSAPVAERCVDFSASTPVGHLFGQSGDALPLDLGAVPSDRPLTVEVAVYAAGGPLCPAEAPLLALGRSPASDLRRQTEVAVALAVRRGCSDVATGITLAPQQLEDMTPIAPTPQLSLADVYAYDALVSTAGACTAPTTFRGQRRHFTAIQGSDANGPTPTLTGPWFWDHSYINGCAAASLDDGDGGIDACIGFGPSGERPVWLPSAAHLAAVRAANRARPGVKNGALIVRIFDKDGKTPFVGAKIYFERQNQLDGARYPSNSDWSDLGADATTSDSGGIALFLDAPSGPFIVDWGDNTGVFFAAGAAADPGAVTTHVVTH